MSLILHLLHFAFYNLVGSGSFFFFFVFLGSLHCQSWRFFCLVRVVNCMDRLLGLGIQSEKGVLLSGW